MSSAHLVILKKQYLDAVIDGSKTVESRLLKGKSPPFGRVEPGDKLFFKQSSGPVLATATAAAVKSFENLTPAKIAEIKSKYNKYILGSDEYWAGKADSAYCVLIRIESVERIAPVRIDKRDWRAWVVLTDEKNFGLLATKPKQ
jgi:ASC-1-like (ASCH) protein